VRNYVADSCDAREGQRPTHIPLSMAAKMRRQAIALSLQYSRSGAAEPWLIVVALRSAAAASSSRRAAILALGDPTTGERPVTMGEHARLAADALLASGTSGFHPPANVSIELLRLAADDLTAWDEHVLCNAMHGDPGSSPAYLRMLRRSGAAVDALSALRCNGGTGLETATLDQKQQLSAAAIDCMPEEGVVEQFEILSDLLLSAAL